MNIENAVGWAENRDVRLSVAVKIRELLAGSGGRSDRALCELCHIGTRELRELQGVVSVRVTVGERIVRRVDERIVRIHWSLERERRRVSARVP